MPSTTSEHMTPGEAHQRLTDEMTFHLSIKGGLSEADDVRLWSLSAGFARGLLLARSKFDREPDKGIQLVRDHVDEYVGKKQRGETLIESTHAEYGPHLSRGALLGTVRALELVTNPDAAPMGETYSSKES